LERHGSVRHDIFLSFPIPVRPVHPRRKKAEDNSETLEQFAPKHPAFFYDGDEQDERGWEVKVIAIVNAPSEG
jgi:hypothetical protein